MIQPGIARLEPSVSGGPRVLVVGRGVLVGASRRSEVRSSGLVRGIAERARDERGRPAFVDVLWDLGSPLQSLIGLAAAGRLASYDAVVIAVEARDVLAPGRRPHRGLAAVLSMGGSGPRVLVAIAASDTESGAAAQAEVRIRAAAAAPGRSAPMVVHVELDRTGAMHEPKRAASEVVQALGYGQASPEDTASSDVVVDGSLRALHGRTSHLRRALVLAQNSFDVPYAQLNLVSHGTLRSLAFIGRSSDGLERSLSAEAVQLAGPLLVADTQQSPRFSQIPETRGAAAVRYYVGHPVHAPAGHAVGVLCVLDTEPHPIERGDDVMIRDLALLAEGELAALTETG